MIYGEIRPDGQFRFVIFGSPPPFVFSAEYGRFMPMSTNQPVQFLRWGRKFPMITLIETNIFRRRIGTANKRLEYSEDHTDEPGDIVFLYSDGVYDGSDEESRRRLNR